MSLNLVEQLEMAITPIVERVDQGPQTVRFSSGHLPLEHNSVVSFIVPASPTPINDVRLYFTALGRLYEWQQFVEVYLNQEYVWPFPTPIAVIWKESQVPDCEPVAAEVVVPLASWTEASGGGPMTIYMRPRLFRGGDLCPGGDWIQLDVIVEYEAPAARDPVPYHGWATHHTTLAGEPRGEPHRHRGEWRVDPLRGQMVCYNESNYLYTLGGLGAVTIDGQLGHGSPTTGEIAATVLRLQTRPGCPEE